MAKSRVSKSNDLQGQQNNLFVLSMQSKDLEKEFGELLQLSKWAESAIKMFLNEPGKNLVGDPEEYLPEILNPTMDRIKTLLESISHKSNAVSMCQYQLFLQDSE